MATRPPIDEATLRELSRPSLARWGLAAAVDWSVIIATFVVAAWVDHPAVYALAVVPLGSRQQALGALFHDASHRLASRSRLANDALGSLLAAFPLGLSLGGYRRYHFAHHRLLGSEADPEIAHRRGIPQWTLPARPARLARDFGGDLVFGGVAHLLAAGGLTRPAGLGEAASLGLFWAAALAVAYLAHALWVPLLWMAAVATVFWSGVRLRIWTEHLGTTDTHRIAVPSWLAHLIMPHDIGLHWEHHHFPAVPFWNLAKLRDVLPPGNGVPPVAPLGSLLSAFFRAGPLPSGQIAEAIGAGAAPRRGPFGEPPPRESELVALRYVAHVLVPLTMGVLVYLLCRRALPRPLSWFPLGGLFASRVPRGFVDVFPDAAWAYALAALQTLLWRGSASRARFVWIASAPLSALGWELAQRARLVPGTFDWADVGFGVAACALAVLLCQGPAAEGEPAAPSAKGP